MALFRSVITGARAKLYVSGKEVGHMSDCSLDLNIQNVALEECGDPIATAIVTVGVQAFVSARFVRVTDTDPFQDAFVPGMTSQEIVDFPEVDIVLREKTTDAEICTVIGCKPESLGLNMGARTMATSGMRWRGRALAQAGE